MLKKHFIIKTVYNFVNCTMKGYNWTIIGTHDRNTEQLFLNKNKHLPNLLDKHCICLNKNLTVLFYLNEKK